MCTTIRTKYHSCGHTEYQNTTHCHLVRRLISSAPYLPSAETAGGSNGNRQLKEVPYLSQGHRQEGPPWQQIRQPPSSNLFGTSRVPPHPETRSRDDHRLLLQTTKWLPDAQPRVPPGLFECAQNVATRPVEGLCRPCQKQQQREQRAQQSRNATPRLENTTPVAAGTPSPLQQSSPQIQGKKEGRRKIQKKNKNGDPSLQPGPPLTTTTSSTSATATLKPGDGVQSSSTTPAILLTIEKSPSRSLTPASMFRRAMQRSRAPSEAPSVSLDVDLTRAMRDSFQKLSLMYGSGTPEPERSRPRSVSAVSRIPEDGKEGGADTGTETSPDNEQKSDAANNGKAKGKEAVQF